MWVGSGNGLFSKSENLHIPKWLTDFMDYIPGEKQTSWENRREKV